MDGENVKQTVGISSIRGYLAAIVDLWSFQKNYGENHHPNPRGVALSSLLASYARRENVRKRKQFIDRAAGTLQDGYNHDKMIDLVRFCWQGWMQTETKHRKPQAVESYLRTVVDFLLSHNMLLRGESRRKLELADLFTILLSHEGPTPCWPMIMIMNNGKSNPFGRLEYMGVMRHRDPLLCTMGQTAFYLFYRWNIAGEPPPQFKQRQQWYGLHLLRGGRGDKPISYEIQLEWINRVFMAVNLTTLKKTHIGRSQGAKQAELEGVGEGQIRRAGRWNNDALSNCYLTHLPQKFLRTMAGFEPSTQGNYYLPRAKILPPPSLVQAIWPWVDTWLAWFKSYGEKADGDRNDGGNRADDNQDKEEDRNDMAAQGFLRLLDQLRTILLQDSVLLREQFPRHPIWRDPIFIREDYREFAEQMRCSLLNTETPEEVRLQQALPAIAQRLNVVRQDVSQVIHEWGRKAQKQLQEIGDHLNDIIAGRVAFTVRALDAPIPASLDPLQSQRPATSADLNGMSPLPGPFMSTLPNLDPFQPAPMYLLSRTIKTVPELWREWTCGLGDNPSVQSLEETYGAAWRPSQSERVMFSRRKVIIDEIYARNHGGTPLSAAVEELELVRTRGRLSLYGLYQLLRKEKTKAEEG
jgi:hypothetical protein